ncbi:MAG: RNA polymerase sigma factor [Gammaproteobacteria bacterium]
MNEAEFSELLGEHAPMLGRVAANYEADSAAREDLLQDIALALWRALPQWRGEASLRSFVARIAHNCCVNHIVRQQRHRHDDMVEDAFVDERADPHRDAVSHERYERLQRALRRLPLGQRQAVTLALEGFSHTEIAAALDIGINNADQRVGRARRTLTRYLEEES